MGLKYAQALSSNVSSESGGIMPQNIFARPIEGFAINILRNQIRGHIQRAENHLKKYAETHPQDAAGYNKRAEGLETIRKLYKGFCGDEEPQYSHFGGYRG